MPKDLITSKKVCLHPYHVIIYLFIGSGIIYLLLPRYLGLEIEEIDPVDELKIIIEGGSGGKAGSPAGTGCNGKLIRIYVEMVHPRLQTQPVIGSVPHSPLSMTCKRQQYHAGKQY